MEQVNFSKNTIPNDIYISYGKGIEFFDQHNKRYLDFCSQTLNLSLGHCNPYVNAEIIKSIEKITFVSSRFKNEYVEKLAHKILNLAPKSLSKINLKVTSGSEANEGALKIAYKKQNSKGVISFIGSHHGQTMETMRISGKNFDKSYLDRNGVFFVNPCSCGSKIKDDYKCECSNEVLDLIQNNNHRIAAVIVEPIMVDAGVLIPKREFLEKIRKYTKEYGVVLIFDEVQTAFGWTGYMFASEFFKVIPDILTASKGLAAGLPLGVILMKEELDNLLYGEHEITHGANSICCASALANLNFLTNLDILKKVQKNSNYLIKSLNDLKFSLQNT